MSAEEWFRCTTWSAAEAAEFERKLARSRGQRTQYLRIQALTLAETNNPTVARPAILLANQYLEEEPRGPFRVQALCTIARASTTVKDVDGAIDAYRRAIEAERFGGIRCRAYLEFAWFATTRGLSDLFDEVLAAIENSFQPNDLIFPITQYKYFAAIALISDALGDSENASRMARNALQAASKHEGPFRRHPDVGMLVGRDEKIFRKIKQLAG
jgi:hypothetical protein